MKYLVIKNKEQEADECLYDIADFGIAKPEDEPDKIPRCTSGNPYQKDGRTGCFVKIAFNISPIKLYNRLRRVFYHL